MPQFEASHSWVFCRAFYRDTVFQLMDLGDAACVRLFVLGAGGELKN